jgi:hypothetical protein
MKSLLLFCLFILTLRPDVLSQNMIALPTHGSVYSSSARGFWFVAPKSFTITGLRVSPEAGTGLQYIHLMKINDPVPVVYATSSTNFTTLVYISGAPNNVIQPVSIAVNAGDIIGVLGTAGTGNSYSSGSSPYASTIDGMPISLKRLIYQGNINTGPAPNYSTENTSSISRVEIYYSSCEKVGNLTASNVTKTSATITWNAAVGSTNYEYVFDQSPADPTIAGTTTTATSYNATGLTPGFTYYFHIKTNCSSNSSGWETVSFTTPVCKPVDNLTISNITSTSAQFDWSTISVADNYEYIITEGSTPPMSSAGTTSTTSTTAIATGLQGSKTYNLFIRSRCFGGDSSTWAQYTFSTFSQCPPPELTATETSKNEWTVSWEKEPTSVAYEYALAGLITPTIGTSVYSNTISLAIPDDGAPYYFYARSKCYNIYNTSPWGRIELRAPLAINDKSNNSSIEVYPNPTKDKFFVHLLGSIDKNSKLTISTVTGETIISMSAEKNILEVDLTRYPAGTYVMHYKSDRNSKTVKITKQ